MEPEDQLKPKKLKSEAIQLFTELEERKPRAATMDDNTLALIELAIKRGYELGYDKFHVPMCDKCKYRSATCFGPGAFCDECSMEEDEEE